MKKIVLGLGLTATALAGTAYAAQAGALGPQARAMMADPLGKATITRAEAETRAGQLFDRLDVNHDGKLDQADRDARMMQRFDQIDTNHDGSISRQEFLAMHQHMAQRGPDGMHHDGPGMGGNGEHMGHHMGHHAMGHGGMKMGMALLGQADANHDGAITRQEFMAAALKRFDAADTNHDGKVTLDERRAAFRAMRNMAPPPPPLAPSAPH